MRFPVTIIVVLFLFGSGLRAQNDTWVLQTKTEAGPSLYAIQTIDAHTAYAVGDTTTFAVLNDSDCTYHMRVTPIERLKKDFFTGLSFLNKNTGVIVGNQALKTTNGGVSWDSLTIPKSHCNGVLMISNDIIIIVGDGNLLIRTTDGGKTWKQHPFIEQDIGTLTSIKKIREDFIVITAESSYLLFSSDSGKTWTTQKYIFGNAIYSVDFDNDSDGVAVGEHGYVIHTSDRGKTWTQHIIDTGYIAQVAITGIERTSSGHYAACGEFNLVMYSNDKGVHWTQATKDGWSADLAFNGISMLDEKIGYACADNGYAIRTTDGGMNWKFLPHAPLYVELYSIAYPKGDTLNGITVGETRTIMNTSDGGEHWEIRTDPTLVDEVRYDLNSVTYADASTAFLVGDGGSIAKSTDHGTSWKRLPCPVTQDLHSVMFLDPQNGWACGDSNTLIKTTTGGASWERMNYTNQVFDNLYSVSFCDLNNGIVGKYRTSDGGKTWIEPTVYLEGRFLASQMLSPTHYVISMEILDGWNHPVIGKLWAFIGDSIYTTSKTYTQFLDIAFADSLHGTVAAQYRITQGVNGSAANAMVFQTSDGGKTWNEQKNPGYYANYGVTMPTSTTASVCGRRLKILKRVNTPQSESVADHSPSTNSPLQILSLYPNPAHDESTLRVYVDRPVEAELRIINMLGVMVKQIDLGIQYEGERDIPVPLEMLSAGKYIVELRSGESVKHLVVGVQ
jgi:photosystem II stability/assembly factor-like uncharacterized protein